MDCTDQRSVCQTPGEALEVSHGSQTPWWISLESFQCTLQVGARLPLHMLLTSPAGPAASLWLPPESSGGHIRSVSHSSLTHTIKGSHSSSLLWTVLSALGMQSTEVTPIICVTASGEDGDV